VAGCSLLLSRLISFFAYEQGSSSSQHKHLKVGSWLLLIRIFIICGGLFLAFAASGIPLDRLTIIMGALSVGVGLGLQGLVNNLVSGLIISFERPVNVGDFIEVSGQAGTVKSIGFRSSVISLTDGACLVIPNGDLLSQHLVNWSMAKNAKRVHLNVGVAYGSNLEKVKALLLSLLQGDDRILSYPEPFVSAKNFGDSAVNFEIICWVKHFILAGELGSDLVIRIDNAFREAGIEIPFPQCDVRIVPEEQEKQQ
jgi:small-conductance mechanosensitive channel